ncbi:MAG: DnaJ domain-containing protein [Bryobacterales bacterium]
MSTEPFIDYYEFLMVSPTADRAMIEWAVRLMLTRYGNKNGEQSDPAKYELVKEAYRTLADPKRRELYDSLRKSQVAPPEEDEPIEFEPPPASAGAVAPVRTKDRKVSIESVVVEQTATRADVELQLKLRQGVMSALYDIVVTRPRNPELGRAEIARSMGARIDEIELTIWFLREKDLLKTTNQGLYSITAKGVEWVENGGVPHLAPPTQKGSDSRPRPPASETNGIHHSAMAGAPVR